VIEAIRGRSGAPIVVGGSGLYLRALLQGLFRGPERDEALRAELTSRIEREGLDALREELRRVDPEAHAAISPGDPVRVIRALEVHRLTGETITALRRTKAGASMDALRFGIRWERSALARRIADRIQDQIRRGFLEQARALAARGIAEGAPGPRTLGYRELLAHLAGAGTLESALETIALRTRQLAKRQETWFRKEPDTVWFTIESAAEFPRVARAIADAAER
ncbi:MAG TPA: tRNA (adenosine(37)-N6)-dimethylallyltransferase MiaA, partial [Acidobacteriota bacterium]|nr:tRNA (adenosine(37)-N6)-dimethylallyltransferase MiaA [Acidobacteriota bacterium]